MNCYDFEQQLQTLLDNRLPVEADSMLGAHRALCSDCAELYAAYQAMHAQFAAGSPCVSLSDDDLHRPQAIAGLAQRVTAEVARAPADHVASKPSPAAVSSRWNSWGSLAVAASLLIAVGVAVVNTDQPATPVKSNKITTADNGTANRTKATNSAEADLAGRDMWYRTGRGLASMAIATWHADESGSALESEATGNRPLLDRAVERLRELLPDTNGNSPNGGETGRWLGRERPLTA